MSVIELKSSYTYAEFQYLFPQESTSVEFKTGVGSEPLQEAFVSFSNRDGGVIFVGVDDGGHVVGRALDQRTEEQINQAAFAARDVGRFECKQVIIGQTEVIGIKVHRRQEGFSQTSNGRILQRHGPRNAVLYGADLREFLNARSLHQFERTGSGLVFTDIAKILLAELEETLGDINSSQEDSLDRLYERGLCKQDGELTIAGALLLTDPIASLSLSKAVIEVRRYPDESMNYNRREVFSGPLHHQIQQATQFLTGELGTDLIVSGLYRYELPRLPEVVIRETIANATGHRSYELNRTAIVVEIRPDRVIVRSPGALPEPVTVRTIRAAQSARNPIIIGMLRRFALAEDAGRGIDVIEDTMKEALLDPPSFADDGSSVTVVLPLNGQITQRERGWLGDLERQGRISGTDRLLIVHAARGESLTNSTARQILGTEDRGLARATLHRLRDADVLRQVGERGNAQYVLVEKLSPPAAYHMSSEQISQHVLSAAQDQSITNEDVRNLTGLDRTAALRLLRQLVRSGELTQSGSRRGTRYRAT